MSVPLFMPPSPLILPLRISFFSPPTWQVSASEKQVGLNKRSAPSYATVSLSPCHFLAGLLAHQLFFDPPPANLRLAPANARSFKPRSPKISFCDFLCLTQNPAPPHIPSPKIALYLRLLSFSYQQSKASRWNVSLYNSTLLRPVRHSDT